MTGNYKNYIRYTRFVLVFVFVVIIAGSVVRITQSGMGCPDWPKCFGMWLPPTNADQLPADYEKYLSLQDIDHSFNAFHTWVEYTNRWATALLGIWILIHVIWSFKLFFRDKKSVCAWSTFLLLATLFQAWLGKRVVDSNLAEIKITTHMIVAILIAAIPIVIIHIVQQKSRVTDPTLKWLSIATILLIVIQIVLGTDVREQIDIISKSFNFTNRNLWVAQLNNTFIIHQVLALIVAAFCISLAWLSLVDARIRDGGIRIFILIIFILASGIILAYAGMPALVQPVHLLLSCWLILEVYSLNLKVK